MKTKSLHHYSAPKSAFENAKILRKNQTKAEWLFWRIVSGRKILGFKFRRQHPISKYIVDFYCQEVLLVIELDGDIHYIESVKRYDKKREDDLKKLGLEIIRFKNEEVLFDTDRTIEKLKGILNTSMKEEPSSSILLPSGEGCDHC